MTEETRKQDTGKTATRKPDKIDRRQFGYSLGRKLTRVYSCCWPLLLAVAITGYSFIIGSSGGIIGFEDPGLVAILFVGALIWLAFEVYRTWRVFRFSVEVSDTGILIDGEHHPWDAIEGINTPDDSASGFKLRVAGREPFSIPEETDGIGDLKAVIESRVSS